MTGPRRRTRSLVASVAIVVAPFLAEALLATPAGAQPVQGAYLYTLANFTGEIRHNFSRVAIDAANNEVYVLYQNVVRIFSPSGMEVHQFGEDLDLGLVADVAVDDRNHILLLTYRESKMAIVDCDYRGRPQSEIRLSGLPDGYSDFSPNRMAFHGGNLYLLSTMGLKLVVAGRAGNVIRGHDLFRLFELEEKERGNVEVTGFSVDRDGNVLMAVAVLFRAFVLSPDGKLDWFGKAASAPGGFNIAAGIVRDSKGYLLIVDKLKAAVQVFDRDFRFVTAFSTRGYKPGQLISPDDLAIDGRERIFVTQTGRRGVSVFQLTHTGGKNMSR